MPQDKKGQIDIFNELAEEFIPKGAPPVTIQTKTTTKGKKKITPPKKSGAKSMFDELKKKR